MRTFLSHSSQETLFTCFKVWESSCHLKGTKWNAISSLLLLFTNAPNFLLLALSVYCFPLQLYYYYVRKINKNSFTETAKLRMMLYFIVANHLASVVLKLIFGQMRPESSGRQDYGMPSSHAMFCGFLSVYSAAAESTGALRRKCISVGLCCFICFSRWALGQHDLRQLVAGIVAGALMGALCLRCRALVHHCERAVGLGLGQCQRAA